MVKDPLAFFVFSLSCMLSGWPGEIPGWVITFCRLEIPSCSFSRGNYSDFCCWKGAEITVHFRKDRGRRNSCRVSTGLFNGHLALYASPLERYFTVQLSSSFTKIIRLSGLNSSELRRQRSLLVGAAGSQVWYSTAVSVLQLCDSVSSPVYKEQVV